MACGQKYIKNYSVSKLTPYINNSREHSEEQISQVSASIKEFGFTNPILIDEDGGIIAGHGRLLAAQKLKYKKIPVIQLSGLTQAQKKAYIIADNQLALNSGWNFELLKIEIDELIDLDFEVDLLGFSDSDMLAINMEYGDLDHDAEWLGMPEFSHDDKTSFRTILVHFTCQEHVDEFNKLVKPNITDRTKFIWFPDIEIEKAYDKSYE